MELTIIYASTTGNTEVVMEKVSTLLTEAGVDNTLNRSESTQTSTVQDNSVFILATSTWGHGIINPLFDDLLDYIQNNSMAGKKAAFVGLGDKAYEPVFFNNGIKILKEAFIKSGGEAICDDLIIDGDPFTLLDTKVPYWTDKLITALKNVSDSTQ